MCERNRREGRERKDKKEKEVGEETQLMCEGSLEEDNTSCEAPNTNFIDLQKLITKSGGCD